MYAIYGDIYHQYTPVMLAYIYIHQHHGSYGKCLQKWNGCAKILKSSTAFFVKCHEMSMTQMSAKVLWSQLEAELLQGLLELCYCKDLELCPADCCVFFLQQP